MCRSNLCDCSWLHTHHWLCLRLRSLDEDLVYLKTVQQLEPYDAPILDLSPKERSHLHDLINDARSVDELYARHKNVKDAPALFLSHQLWEKANPGQMWDAPDSKYRQ
jgi:hypothetical protein